MAEHDGGTVPPNTGAPTGTPDTTGTTPTTTNNSGTGTPDTQTPPTTPPTTEDPLTIDIKAAVQKARQEEKDKVYGRITQAETDAKAAREALADAQAQMKTLNETLNKMNAGSPPKTGEEPQKKAPPTSSEDIQKAIEAAARTTLERAEKEIFGPRLAILEKANQDLTTQLKTKDLDAYRKSLIEEHKEAIIPELVTGETKELLDESLVVAKQAFARIASALTQQQGDVANRAANRIPPLPSLNKGNAPDAQTSVFQLSDSEYAERREALLREASEQVRGSLSEQPLE